MTMRAEKQRRLEAAGWRWGDAREFLGLTDDEVAYIELRLKLARALKARRAARGLSQVDLLIRSLLALGTSNRELGRMISGP